MEYRYWLYGVTLRSVWRLPWPERSDAGLAQIHFLKGESAHFQRASRQVAATSDPRRWFLSQHLRNGSLYLRWSGLFEFVISPSGQRIAGRPLVRGATQSFHSYLFGQVLSLALVRRGLEPLHCTAVEVEGQAIGFLGDCGYGKSSMGAAFIQAGCPLLTDDLLVVEDTGGRFIAHPGPPRIKLFPEAAAALLTNQGSGTPMNPLTRKLIFPLRHRQACTSAVPLRALYVLQPLPSSSNSRRIVVRELSARQAFRSLIANTLNSSLAIRERLVRQFKLLGEMGARVPVRAVSYPRSLALLPRIRDAICDDLNR